MNRLQTLSLLTCVVGIQLSISQFAQAADTWPTPAPTPAPSPYAGCQPVPGLKMIDSEGKLDLPANGPTFHLNKKTIEANVKRTTVDFTTTFIDFSARTSLVVQSEKMTNAKGESVVRPSSYEIIGNDDPEKGMMSVTHVEFGYREDGTCIKGRTTQWTQKEKSSKAENPVVTFDPALCIELNSIEESQFKAAPTEFATARTATVKKYQDMYNAMKLPVPGSGAKREIKPTVAMLTNIAHPSEPPRTGIKRVDSTSQESINQLAASCKDAGYSQYVKLDKSERITYVERSVDFHRPVGDVMIMSRVNSYWAEFKKDWAEQYIKDHPYIEGLGAPGRLHQPDKTAPHSKND